MINFIGLSIGSFLGYIEIDTQGLRTSDVNEVLKHNEKCSKMLPIEENICYSAVVNFKIGYCERCDTHSNDVYFSNECKSYDRTIECYRIPCKFKDIDFYVSIDKCIDSNQLNLLKYHLSEYNHFNVFIISVLTQFGHIILVIVCSPIYEKYNRRRKNRILDSMYTMPYFNEMRNIDGDRETIEEDDRESLMGDE